ncbi:MAG: formylglycine-generating enzyme family protein [Leptothrix sp. (in: b-proteobacteria)]
MTLNRGPDRSRVSRRTRWPDLRTWLIAAWLGSLTALLLPTAALAAPAAAAAARFRDCDDDRCPWLVPVPAGAFTMGSPPTEGDVSIDEGPQHRVQLRRFAIGQFEVTFAQWDACVAAGGCPAQPLDEGWGRGAQPVIHMTWDLTQRYLKWLSRRTGQTYRLPSESEWEYAARAGTTTPFGLGERIDPTSANIAGGFTYNGSKPGIDRQRTTAVGSFAPNAWGLHDMHGNVWEWVQDCWHRDYEGAPANGSAWTRRCDEDRHVLRGGSWYDTAAFARAAARRGLEAGSITALGFRVVREIKP